MLTEEQARHILRAAERQVKQLTAKKLHAEVAWRYAIIDELLRLLTGNGAPIIVSGYRDPKRQKQLLIAWQKGKPGIIGRPARFSQHTVGRAIDVQTKHPNFALFSQLWALTGGRVGSEFGDPPHFDVPDPEHPPPAAW